MGGSTPIVWGDRIFLTCEDTGKSLHVGASGPVLGTYTVNSRGTVTITPASGSTAP